MNANTDEYAIETERINLLADYVCSSYGLTYHELADALGVNRGRFTMMRKGGFGQWGFGAVVGLIKLAAKIDDRTLFGWIFDERQTTPRI